MGLFAEKTLTTSHQHCSQPQRKTSQHQRALVQSNENCPRIQHTSAQEHVCDWRIGNLQLGDARGRYFLSHKSAYGDRASEYHHVYMAHRHRPHLALANHETKRDRISFRNVPASKSQLYTNPRYARKPWILMDLECDSQINM